MTENATHHIPVAKRLVLYLAGCMLCLACASCGHEPAEVSGTPAKALKNGVQPAANESGEVAEVVFDGETISEEMIQSWVNNPSLRRLRIAGSGIDDAGLIQLAKMQKLELLDLTGCEKLTSVGIEAIGNIASLRNLRVSGPAVTDPAIASFSRLSNVAALSLQQTAVTDNGLRVVDSMTGLKELNLYGTTVTDSCLATIAALPSLQKLRLRGTGVTGHAAESFVKMAALTELDLSETAFVSNGLQWVGKMPKLRSLNLWLTKVDDGGIDFLSEQKQLTLLNLDNVSGITDKSLEIIRQISNLELLHLGGTSITAEGLPKLYDLKNLKTLFVTRLMLQESDVQKLKDAMPWVSKLES